MNPLLTLTHHLRASLDWAMVRMDEALLGRELEPVAVRGAWPLGLLRKISPALAIAASLAACAAPACASAWDRAADTWFDGRLVDVQIQVDGEAAPLYWAPGRDDRRYVEAFAGRNYSLVLRNNSPRRIGVLIAVDGLNVVNGEISQLQGAEPMYVLSPWERTTIRGWRTNLEQIRRFKFVDEQRSYAERTGQANSDMGWIRVLSFRETRPWYARNDEHAGQRNNERRQFEDERRSKEEGQAQRGAKPTESEDAPMAADQLDARPEGTPVPSSRGEAKSRLAEPNSVAPQAPNGGSFPGTGWGDQKYEPVARVDFRPESRATDHLVMRYEYGSGLRALGIFPSRDRLRERDGQVGFAKPPRW